MKQAKNILLKDKVVLASDEIEGASFDLSTETGVTTALAAIVRAFGGTATGTGEQMKKDAPILIRKNGNTYAVDVYDDSQGMGLDITRR